MRYGGVGFESRWVVAMSIVGVGLLAAVLPAKPALGQETAEQASIDGFESTTTLPPVFLEESEEVILALSGGPPSIWPGAAAYVLTPSGYVKAREGSNGFHCLVLRAPRNPEVLGPACFDEVASRYVLPVELEEGRLITSGLPADSIDARLARGFDEGTFVPPPEAGVAYMLSEGQHLGAIGRWKPHVMIYAPGRTNESIGGDPGDTRFPFIAFEEGRAHATMVIPTADFMSPEDVARALAVEEDEAPAPPERAEAGASGSAVPGAIQPGFEVGLPPLMPTAEEIRLARSAAPAEQSGRATVLVLARGGYEVAHQGDNGWTCYVSRARIVSVEPICYDPEASRTILPVRLRRAELVEQGVPVAEARERVAAEIRAGKYPAPTGPALAFMMSSGQVLYGAGGQRAGAWKPHMHVFMPGATTDDLALGEGGRIGGVVTMTDPGDLTASLVVVLPEFIDPEDDH